MFYSHSREEVLVSEDWLLGLRLGNTKLETTKSFFMILHPLKHAEASKGLQKLEKTSKKYAKKTKVSFFSYYCAAASSSRCRQKLRPAKLRLLAWTRSVTPRQGGQSIEYLAGFHGDSIFRKCGSMGMVGFGVLVGDGWGLPGLLG